MSNKTPRFRGTLAFHKPSSCVVSTVDLALLQHMTVSVNASDHCHLSVGALQQTNLGSLTAADSQASPFSTRIIKVN